MKNPKNYELSYCIKKENGESNLADFIVKKTDNQKQISIDTEVSLSLYEKGKNEFDVNEIRIHLKNENSGETFCIHVQKKEQLEK